MDRRKREELLFRTENAMLPRDKRRCPRCFGRGTLDAQRQILCETCAGTGKTGRKYNPLERFKRRS